MSTENKAKLIIEGGHPLAGEIRIDSAKNAVLPILAACILHKGIVRLEECTPISDVVNMLEILKRLGSSYTLEGTTITVDSSESSKWEIPPDLAGEIRSSIFLMGSILSRFKKAKVSHPGGCAIGMRPIDLHLKGLRTLNCKITEENGFIVCDGTEMRNGIVYLDFPSVGATENIMMAAVTLEGRTQIINAAKEPEIVDLQNFINALGGKVEGAGTGIINITGVDRFRDTVYIPIKDRIIAGTYLLAGAITGSRVMLKGADAEHIFSLICKLRESGFDIYTGETGITICPCDAPKASKLVETEVYPGFATDLQAQMTAMQTVSKGSCIITENIFETRFKHVPELNKMGADITVRGRSAHIRGVPRLKGAPVEALDLRGGASLVLAGLNARGTTIVSNPQYIDRGYYKLEDQLSSLGAKIYRE